MGSTPLLLMGKSALLFAAEFKPVFTGYLSIRRTPVYSGHVYFLREKNVCCITCIEKSPAYSGHLLFSLDRFDCIMIGLTVL